MTLLNNSAPRHNQQFGIIIIFIVCSLVGATMLMMVATLLLAEWLGSLVAALALLGGLFAFVALLLYWCSVRPSLQQLHNDIQLISTAAQYIRSGWSWVSTQLSTLFKAGS